MKSKPKKRYVADHIRPRALPLKLIRHRNLHGYRHIMTLQFPRGFNIFLHCAYLARHEFGGVSNHEQSLLARLPAWGPNGSRPVLSNEELSSQMRLMQQRCAKSASSR